MIIKQYFEQYLTEICCYGWILQSLYSSLFKYSPQLLIYVNVRRPGFTLDANQLILIYSTLDMCKIWFLLFSLWLHKSYFMKSVPLGGNNRNLGILVKLLIVLLCFSFLLAAALGNLVSDVAGVGWVRCAISWQQHITSRQYAAITGS